MPKEATGFQDGEEQPAKVRNAGFKLPRGAYPRFSLPSQNEQIQDAGVRMSSEPMPRSASLKDGMHAQVLHDMIMPHTDSGAAVGDAIVSFGAVAVLAPRGRFEVELYGSFMKLLGQVRDGCVKLGCGTSALTMHCGDGLAY